MTKTKNRKPLLDYLSVVRVPGIPERPGTRTTAKKSNKGFLFLVFVIVIIAVAQISIVLVYYQLCNEGTFASVG